MTDLQSTCFHHIGVGMPQTPAGRPSQFLAVWCISLNAAAQYSAAAGLQTDAQRKASDLGIALVVPDTSPPRLGIAGEEEEWALGVGAGFYVDAETGAAS